MKNNFKKVAVFYDWINQWGGAERVLLNILAIYPQATIFTLTCQSNWAPKNQTISTSFLNKIPFKLFPLFSPIFDIAAEQLDLSDFDLIISTTSTIGHCLITNPNSLFVCYYHNINRRLYPTNNPILKFYQKIDNIYSKRPDFLLCNSRTVQSRIKNTFNREAQIIYPGIDTKFFTPIPKPKNDYFLCVGRLVKHKNIDQVISVFKNLPYTLKIVGSGRDQNRFKKLAQNSKNIHFLGSLSENDLLETYQNCIALIHPQIEDFGLTSLEAQACGRGVIALNIGGATETVTSKTGILYQPGQLLAAINQYLTHPANSIDCRQHALKFSDQKFMLDFKNTIQNLWLKT